MAKAVVELLDDSGYHCSPYAVTWTLINMRVLPFEPVWPTRFDKLRFAVEIWKKDGEQCGTFSEEDIVKMPRERKHQLILGFH